MTNPIGSDIVAGYKPTSHWWLDTTVINGDCCPL